MLLTTKLPWIWTDNTPRSLPIIVIMYILNYLDRNNIAAAKLAGLIEDTHLKGDEFNTTVSILFVGYLFMQGMQLLVVNVCPSL